MSSPVQPPSVAITSLSIRDFRGIEALDLDFRGPDGNPNSLVVLAGPNGCGKTSVLEAAVIVAGGTKLITGPRGRPAIRRGAASYEIRANFQRGSETWQSKDVAGVPDATVGVSSVTHWYFSSWRTPTLVGPVYPTVGRPGRPRARTDQNRLRIVKQLLVNAATVERFENPLPELGHYTTVIRTINEAWREFYPEAGQPFAVEIVSPQKAALGRI